MHHNSPDNPFSPLPNESSTQPNGTSTPRINGHSSSAEKPAILTNGNNAGPAWTDTGTPDTPAENVPGEPPVKRRKVVDTRAISPPWKKPSVEGPTSFTLNGKRVSARTNIVPLELQAPSDKRTTRATVYQSTSGIKSRYGGANTAKPSAAAPPVTPAGSKTHHVRSSSRVVSTVTSSPTKTSPRGRSQTTTTPSAHNTPKSYGKRARRRSSKLNPDRTPSPPPPKSSSPGQKRRPGRPRKQPIMKQDDSTSTTNDSSEADDEHEEEHKGDLMNGEVIQDSPSRPTLRPQRLKFSVRMPTLTAQHPNNLARPKKFVSLREWSDNTNPFDTPGDTILTDEQAKQQASVRDRIHRAAEPGGLLSSQQCTAYMPSSEDEPEKQYSHHDRLLKHFENFRRLLEKEHNRHRAEARKLANDCAARWKEMQPEPQESEEDFQARRSQAILRQCLVDLEQKFEALRQQVLTWRIDRYKEELEIQGRQNLNLLIQQSEEVLRKARFGHGSDATTTEENNSDESGRTQGSTSEENMSSESSNEESSQEAGGDDDKLSPSELKLKYENVRKQDTENLENTAPQCDGSSSPENSTGPISRTRNTRSKPETLVNGSMDLAISDDDSNPLLDDDDESIATNDGEDESPGEEFESGSEADSSSPEEDLGLASLYGFSRPTERDGVNQEAGSLDTVKTEIGDNNAMEIDGPLMPTSPLKRYPAVNTIISPDDSVDGRNEAPSHDYSTSYAAVDEDDLGEEDEVSLIPDGPPEVFQVQTPSASNSESTYVDVQKEVEPPPADPEPEAQPLDPQEPNHSEVSATKDNMVSDQEDAATVDTNMSMISAQKEIVAPATPVSQSFRTPVPALLRGTLREYQHHGLDWMAGLYNQHHKLNGPGGILADEMGLGKTIQSIALLAHVAEQHEQWGPHLVIVPSSVLMNWEMEFKKFLPGFKILTYYGSAEERKQKRKGWLDDDKWNVVIAPYSVVTTDQNSFKRRMWHYLILDEAHNIKNWRSQKWQTMLTFKAYRRLLLTGTPLQNNISELWSLVNFMSPPDPVTGKCALPGLQDFQTMFKEPVTQIMDRGQEVLDEKGRGLVRELHRILRPYILRRLKADVEKQMPSKYEHVLDCKLSKRQRHLYDGFMSRTETKATLASGNYLSIINCLMQLRKVCNHPDLFETRPIVTSFAMPKSAIADYEIKELLIRRKLLQDEDGRTVSLDVVNLLPGANGPMPALYTIQNARLGALGRLRELIHCQTPYSSREFPLNGSNESATLSYLENQARLLALDDLRHRAYLTSLRSQRRPLFSYFWADKLRGVVKCLPDAPQPQRRVQWSDWFTSLSPVMNDLVKNLSRRSENMEPYLQRFSCVTPAVVAPRMTEFALPKPAISGIQELQTTNPDDAFHEARMRLSIAFPDKRLLQWDCGKLQRLDALLRKLAAGGHRALIFTQMTKVLDLLEQFLNIHGHRYLRLDGSTKIDQRHILTERFNHDPRILCFILSSRSGGLGINLTGADTVIFYDLDWNPAMDKQCQDRCHRIGQTRDVHVYRLVSEHTVEANILRKSNQKRRLDDVIIQDGDFTTDYFRRPHPTEAFADHEDPTLVDDIEADGAAMVDRALGTGDRPALKVLEQAEDREDATAARVAAKESAHIDDADFGDAQSAALRSTQTSRPQTPRRPNATTASHSPADSTSAGPEKPRRGPSAAGSLTAMGADPLSDTYRRGTVAPRSEAEEDIFQGAEPIGVDRYLVHWALRELEGVDLEDILERAGVKAKKKKKKGPEHIVAKKKGY